ncbi:MAG: hypothetical protein A2Y92_00245 [Chloroflexi bacterium RBG_13_57_8]|nr:MAG: hypothetical protein A2Y92_00245 [Chloroflexi bacterium RBG_13_57_8]
MSHRVAEQLREIGGRIEEFAGTKTREKVMAGSEKVVKSKDRREVALWVKEAIDRLDASTTPEKCRQIMAESGHSCIAHNTGLARGIKNRRQKYPTEEAFLKVEVKKPIKGTRLELRGNTLIQYYTPHTYSTPRRCFCGLMFALPEGFNVSPTYCQCSRGFVEKYWEGALGRPVRVEVKETAITGADECKFIIHL